MRTCAQTRNSRLCWNYGENPCPYRLALPAAVTYINKNSLHGESGCVNYSLPMKLWEGNVIRHVSVWLQGVPMWPLQICSLDYPYPAHMQGRIFLRLSFQWLSSVFRVSFQSARKKSIIMHIQENNAYWLGTMGQDADSVWAMILNCLGDNNMYSQ